MDTPQQPPPATTLPPCGFCGGQNQDAPVLFSSTVTSAVVCSTCVMVLTNRLTARAQAWRAPLTATKH